MNLTTIVVLVAWTLIMLLLSRYQDKEIKIARQETQQEEIYADWLEILLYEAESPVANFHEYQRRLWTRYRNRRKRDAERLRALRGLV